jgi:ABC-type Mn2+/Zn2+ transport system permease subunit
MSRIPTADDWRADPAAALASSLEIAKATSAHGDATSQGIAFGIAAKVIAAAAPLVGGAVGGPLGALAGAAVAQLATQLEQQGKNAQDSLTPEQLILIDQAVAIGVQAASRK